MGLIRKVSTSADMTYRHHPYIQSAHRAGLKTIMAAHTPGIAAHRPGIQNPSNIPFVALCSPDQVLTFTFYLPHPSPLRHWAPCLYIGYSNREAECSVGVCYSSDVQTLLLPCKVQSAVCSIMPLYSHPEWKQCHSSARFWLQYKSCGRSLVSTRYHQGLCIVVEWI